jgi:hypothetical protein
VPVQFAAAEKFAEREMIDHGRAAVRTDLEASEIADHLVRREHPAEAQRGRQGLAAGPDVDHAIGCHALERAERLAVVAIFRVVVVLDEQGVLCFGPREQIGSTSRRHPCAGRELMDRRDDRAPCRCPRQAVDHQPLVVDRNGMDDDVELREERGQPAETGVLDGDIPDAPGLEEPGRELDALQEAVAHHDAVRMADGRPRAAEIGGEGFSRGQWTARVGIAEGLGRCSSERAAQTLEPRRARKRHDIRRARPEIEARRRRLRFDVGRARHGGPDRRDPGAGPWLGTEVAFGDQLFVRLDDHAARRAEIVGE